MRVKSIVMASVLVALSAGAVAEDLVSKQTILDSLLGQSRSIGKQQRRAVDLPTVTFEFDLASLTPQGRQQLEILAEALKEGRLVDRRSRSRATPTPTAMTTTTWACRNGERSSPRTSWSAPPASSPRS